MWKAPVQRRAKRPGAGNKRLLPSLGVLALLLIAAVAVTLLPAPESAARPACDCVGSFETAEQVGQGTTCGEATYAAYTQAFALAEQVCGQGNVCEPTFIASGTCQQVCGVVLAAGKLHYGCCEGTLW